MSIEPTEREVKQYIANHPTVLENYERAVAIAGNHGDYTFEIQPDNMFEIALSSFRADPNNDARRCFGYSVPHGRWGVNRITKIVEMRLRSEDLSSNPNNQRVLKNQMEANGSNEWIYKITTVGPGNPVNYSDERLASIAAAARRGSKDYQGFYGYVEILHLEKEHFFLSEMTNPPSLPSKRALKWASN